MINYTFVLFLIFSCTAGYGQTQRDMENEMHQTHIESDLKLNNVYQQLLRDNKTDTVFIENLRAAQRNWIKYRDSEIKLLLPEFYGSYVLCSLSVLNQFTEERVAYFNQWITGIEEGDVCTGSRKIATRTTDEKIHFSSVNREACELELVKKERLNGLQLGASYAEVTGKIGKPDSLSTSNGAYDELYIVWHYPELQLTLTFFADIMVNGTIQLVTIDSKNSTFKTAQEVAVGDDYEQFKNAYETQLALFYTEEMIKENMKNKAFSLSLGDASGIRFFFSDGIITQIYLSSYWGPPC